MSEKSNVVITGASGGGKTTVLVHLVHVYHRYFNYCQWIHVCNSVTDVRSIRAVAREGQMTFWDTLGADDQANLLSRVTCVCVCVRVCACVRVCMRACVCVCVRVHA